jgi:hypothetical protein
MEQKISPAAWTQHGGWSRIAAALLRPRQPPVLVLSLPRSGSSWAGEALGCAINALYLREPITQSDHAFYDLGTVFEIKGPELEAKYRRLADKAFAGWPDFGSNIVRFPEQWRLRQRPNRRVVIKEVNPLACSWYVQHYRPRTVFLVRHPAAVALSWQRNGWLEANAESWAKNGEQQATALRATLSAFEKYSAHRLVLYEELCADPMSTYRQLFSFAGLSWDAQAAQFIAERTRQNDAANTWDTARNSQEMIHGWRKQAVQANVDALRAKYQPFGLPWYREDADWIV